MPRPRRNIWALASLLSLLPGMAMACRQALVLALDVSLSVDVFEFRLQREGLARALEDSHVASAMIGTGADPVELAVFEWTGQHNQDVLVDWTVIDSRATLNRIASTLRTRERSLRSGLTALGAAMLFGRDMLMTRTHCTALTLDISGDGANNNGVHPALVRPEMAAAGITVNGLVIEPEPESMAVSHFFNDHVITGPGAFVETIHSFDSYAEAIHRKLLREIMPSLSEGAPGSRREARQIPRSDAPADKPKGGVADMRGHAPHLPVAPL